MRLLIFFIQAKIYAEETDDHYTRGLIYHVIGENYNIQYDRRTALEYHKLALNEYLQTGNKPNILSATRNIGMMYRIMGMYEEAIPAGESTLESHLAQLVIQLKPENQQS